MIYTSARRGQLDVLSKPVDVFGAEEVILEEEADQRLSALSPDGKWLAVELWPAEMGTDLALLELGAGSGLTTVVASPFVDEQPSFSRDSAWLRSAMTECSRNARSISAKTSSASGFRRSTPSISAPRLPDSGRTRITR